MIEGPRILLIESSGNICSVATIEGSKIISEHTISEPNQHDKMMAELIRKTLYELSLSINDFDAIAVSAGPGSFTGLRIGASIAKGLTFGNKPKLISLPTLQAVAENYTGNEDFYVIIGSHKDMAYFQKFDKFANQISDLLFLNYNEIKELLADSLELILTMNVNTDLFNRNTTNIQLNAATLAKLALKYFQNDRFTDASEFVPDYQQEFVVKIPAKHL